MAEIDSDILNELMRHAARGDQSAFRRFYDLSSPSILAFLLRLTRDRYHAEDILQDAMVIAWNKASEFDANRASAKTWITTIARRRALDLLRSRSRREEILHDDAANIRATLGLEGGSRESVSESTATDNRLDFCFGELNGDAAACIRLAYLDGLTFAEIAMQLERSLGTVKSWIRRGLSKLKECMTR